jgi:hypothetical protein
VNGKENRKIRAHNPGSIASDTQGAAYQISCLGNLKRVMKRYHPSKACFVKKERAGISRLDTAEAWLTRLSRPVSLNQMDTSAG